MDAKTLEALKASIRKWEKNAEAETLAEYKTGSRDCALCLAFHCYYNDNLRTGCGNCPVAIAGYTSCGSTPYDKACRAVDDWSDDPTSDALRQRAHEVAREEVAFLKSLLPEGESV